MLLMVQKEAAERFTAEPGARVYGPLAVLSRLRFETAQELCTLAPDKYYPQPSVHSAVVLLKGNGALAPERAPAFGAFLAAAFAMRRKTLFNNLTAAGYPRERLPEICAKRAEALTGAQLLSLFELLEGEPV
jgi:16S rRNA (adenine1518-N6/adenine1519-N6)-dimethyltransferase